jgi:PIN domain nuclease of toxin-antitoxin system
LTPRLLLDTHILIRWLGDQKRLSREQSKALQRSVQRMEPVALSAVTLIEIAVLVSDGRIGVPGGLDEFFLALEANPIFMILPVSFEIALEVASLGFLKDPADRTIVATARAHRLTLLTSDARIIESQLVKIVE